MNNMVGLFNNFKEMRHLGNDMFVERLLYFIQVIWFCNQYTHWVDVFLSFVDLFIVFVLT